MDTRPLLRLGAAAGLICGCAIALAGGTELALGHKIALTQLLNGGAVPFGIGLLVAMYALLHRELGRFGATAFAVQFLGFGYFAGVAYTKNFVLVFLERPVVDDLLMSPARFAFLATAIIALTGTVAFGTALLRTDTVPRIVSVLYTVGLSALCLTFLLPAPVVRTGHIVAGVGMIWLASIVWSNAGRTESVAHPTQLSYSPHRVDG